MFRISIIVGIIASSLQTAYVMVKTGLLNLLGGPYPTATTPQQVPIQQI